MANLTSTLTVRLLDKVSGPAAAASAAILGIGKSVATANRAGGMSAMLMSSARAAERAATRMTAFANATRGAAMPFGILGGLGAKAVYDFEKMSNAVQAATEMTDAQRQSLQEYASSLNSMFTFTNKEIMSAAFELGRAGFKFDQIMGALRGTLNLATAGDIGLQEASDIATNVLTAMRLPMQTTQQAAESLKRVNDALSYAAANSNTDVRMMGETFKYVGPIAAAAGMSINEVAAASMVMARNGIRGSEAGVALRSALVRMVKPTSFMNQALERLNVNLADYVKGGKQVSANDIIGSLAVEGIDARGIKKQIEAALKDPSLKGSLGALTRRLTDIVGGDGSAIDKSKLAETINNALQMAGSQIDFLGFIAELKAKGADVGDIARIFDARQGSRLITLLAGNLSQTLQDIERESKDATDKMARTRMKGIVGVVARHVAAWENLALAIAKSGVLESATKAIEAVTGLLQDLAKTNPKILEMGTYAALITAVVGPFAIAAAAIIRLMTMIVKLGNLAMGAVATGAGIGAGTAAGAGAAAGAAAARKGLLRRALGPLGAMWGAWELGAAAGRQLDRMLGTEHLLGGGKLDTLEKWAEENKRFRETLERARKRLEQPEAATRDSKTGDSGPSVPSVPPQSVPADPKAAEDAGGEVGRAFLRGVERELKGLERIAAEAAQRLGNITASPRIVPHVDGSALRGIHGDVGVDVAR